MTTSSSPATDAAGRVERDESSTQLGMLVGIDGSPGSNHALAWAVAHEEQFGPIQPVAAWSYPMWAMADPMLGAPAPIPVEEMEEAAQARADEIVASVPGAEDLRPILTRSSPGPALVELGASYRLIVVGTRGRGALADGLLGSVSSHVVAHATVPVVVVPPAAPVEQAYRRIVVGIDGSENSIAALVWAMRIAAGDVDIEAVHAWTHHFAAVPEPYGIPPDFSEKNASETLDRVIATARERAGEDAREVVGTLVHGDPRAVLRSAPKESDLLVLGARGHRGVAHLLLGSVTTGLIHQPLVTTVVVPSTGD